LNAAHLTGIIRK